jgi:hypothetical protein
MNLPTVERNSYLPIFLVAIVLGALLYLGFTNYSDDLLGLFGKKGTNEDTTETTTPYFAAGKGDQYIGSNDEWEFQVFQPEVVEYSSEGDLNYMTVKYTPDLNFTEDGDEMQVKVLVSSQGQIVSETDLEEKDTVTAADLNLMLSPYIRIEETFDWTEADLDAGPQYITFEQLQERFPVGERIALRVLSKYPAEGVRTTEYCDGLGTVWICPYVSLFSDFFDELDAFYDGEEVSSDFSLILYSVSDELLTREES